MGIPRELVKLGNTLYDLDQVDLFAPLEDGGLLEIPEVRSLISRVAEMNLSDPTRIVRLCLQALLVQREELSPDLIDAEFVATLPPEAPIIARPTQRVLQEMIGSSINEIILLGYEFTEKAFLQLLGEASARNVDIIMICDREKGSAQKVLDAWPKDVKLPLLYMDKQRQEGTPYASMHAKCILVDSRDLLVTSANFTFHGLHGNIELGVRLSGSPAVEARKIFSFLVEHKIVEEF